MTFYNDFAHTAPVVVVRRGARRGPTRRLGGGTLGAGAGAAVAMCAVMVVSWQGWALALGPVLAALPFALVALLGALLVLSVRKAR